MALSTTRPNGLSSTLSTRSAGIGSYGASASAPARSGFEVLAGARLTVSAKLVPPLRNDDVAAHRARERFHRRQSEPGAAEARRDRDIGLRERPEQPSDLAEL